MRPGERDGERYKEIERERLSERKREEEKRRERGGGGGEGGGGGRENTRERNGGEVGEWEGSCVCERK